MKDKLMTLIKKAWPMLAAVAVIGLGAGLLYGAIGKSQADELKKSITKAQPKTVQPEVVEPVLTPTAESVTPFDALRDKSEKSYQVVDVLNENGLAPTAADISLERVGELAYENIKNVFGYELNGEYIYANYKKYSGVMDARWVLLIGKQYCDIENGKYEMELNSKTGQLCFISTVIPSSDFESSTGTKADFAGVDNALMTDATLDEQCFKLVRDTVERALSNGREILEIQCNAVHWGFSNNENSKVFADFDVRMSEGECYRVSVAYPGIYVTDIWFYPLGWESCFLGITDEAELKRTLEEREARGLVIGGSLSVEPTPTPTPVPVPAADPTLMPVPAADPTPKPTAHNP